MYRKFLKRIIDVLISLIVIIFLSPIFIILIVLLSISNHGKPFFLQSRPGLNCKLFKLVKFKTMNDYCDANGKLLPDRYRLTKVGRFMRSTSLDELPQMLNVLKGDMSLIGPRPLLVKYLPLYNDFQKRRHILKPGITGWAQVNGRNALSWEEKFKLDIWYVDNCSFLFDCKILWLTVIKVFKREGINASSQSTMMPFDGSN